MEARLKTLDKSDVNRLNASQVITSLANVVKELLENALDAGATRVGKEENGVGERKKKGECKSVIINIGSQ
jgi:DNA mismatch repair ATPase MutL